MQIIKKHNLSKQNNQVHAWRTEHNKLSELSKLVKNLCDYVGGLTIRAKNGTNRPSGVGGAKR